jgi:hypothetical protein
MRCYFMRAGHIVAVELIPGLTDEQAIEKGHTLFAARKKTDRYEAFEVWDRTRMLIQYPPRVEQPIDSSPKRDS